MMRKPFARFGFAGQAQASLELEPSSSSSGPEASGAAATDRLPTFGPWGISPATFDAAVALILSVSILAEGISDNGSINPLLLLLAVPLAWRRIYPLPVFGVVLLGAIVAVTDAQYVGFFCIMVAAYSVGAYSRYRLLSLAVFLATATGVDAAYGGALPNFPNAWGPFLVLIPFWLIGTAMRTRQLRADAFENKAARLEREREAALAEERARIARELHDVVAHTVSVMVVQAGAARQVLTSSPEEARQALLAVEASGREAMTELRNMLGVLNEVPSPSSPLSHAGRGGDHAVPNGDRSEQAEAMLAPQPGLAQLEPLVQRVRDAGLPVELRVRGDPVPLGAGLDLAAFRIVQEALTNALKYSNLARTQVILDYRNGQLKLEILDDGPGTTSPATAGAGRGLPGMRERVAMYGGRLEAGPRLEGGYAVRAWMPIGESQAQSSKP